MQKKHYIIGGLLSTALLFSPAVVLASQHLPAFLEGVFSTLPTSTRAQAEQDITNALSNLPSAEQTRNDALADLLEINASPATPGPFEKVSLDIISYLTDLNRADILWYINDRLQTRGTGNTLFSFTTEDVGSTSRIDVVINTAEDIRITKQIIFRPAGVDFMWEALTYTPPFYKGKALLSAESPVKIVAMPQFVTSSGTTLSSKELVYLWTEDDEAKGAESGYGKNVFITRGPIPFWDQPIEVEVSSLGNTLKVKEKIELSIVPTKVLFYEDSPLEGVSYEQVIQDERVLSKSELTVRAEPYFFSNIDRDLDNITYEWTINNTRLSTNKPTATFRPSEGQTGISRITLGIKNLAGIYQRAQDSFIINFQQSGGFGF